MLVYAEMWLQMQGISVERVADAQKEGISVERVADAQKLYTHATYNS